MNDKMSKLSNQLLKSWDEITRKESEEGGSDAETGVIVTEWNAEDGQSTDCDANVGNKERIDNGKIRDVTGDDTTHGVGDSNNWKEEWSSSFVNTLVTNQQAIHYFKS